MRMNQDEIRFDFHGLGPAARHERRAGERRETDENAYDSVR